MARKADVDSPKLSGQLVVTTHQHTNLHECEAAKHWVPSHGDRPIITKTLVVKRAEGHCV